MHDRLPNLLIRASAGSGKTYQLANRFLALLLRGVLPEQILATTFTRKAAGEILQRIILRLALAATDGAGCDELDNLIAGSTVSRSTCLRLLPRVISNLHRLQVSTLDSLFARIVRSFSLDLGIPPAWSIADDLDDGILRDRAISDVLRDDGDRDLLTVLNLLTKGEATRGVSDLLRTTVDDLYDLFQETTPEAWTTVPRGKPLAPRELVEVLDELRTLDLAHNSRLAKAREGDLAAAASEHWDDFIGKGLAPKIIDGSCRYYKKEIDAPLVAIYRRLISHARSVIVGRVALQTEGTYQLLKRFDRRYQQLKIDRRALRFDDVTRLLARWARLAQVDRLSFRLDACVNHLLLDEFQDTSLAQWQALRPFARHVTCPLPERSFFCVGDVKQAIYGWRGGNAQIFDALTDELNDIEPKHLEKSYRSSPPVIDTTNLVFQGMQQHPNLDREQSAVQQWSDQFPKHSTEKTQLKGYARLVTAPGKDDELSADEAKHRFVAQQVAELLRQAPGLGIGVLARGNATVSQLIHQLRQIGVHASQEGGNPLTDSAAVQQILALLTLADHPGDTVARFLLAHGPLGPALEVDTHEDAGKAVHVSSRVREMLIRHGYGPTVFRWAAVLARSCDPREARRLGQFVELAYGFQRRATTRVDDFVQLVKTQRVADPSTADVRVMTLHQAKGLEFDIVVLPDLDTKLIGQADAFVVHRADPTGPVQRVCRYASADVQKLLPDDLRQMFRDAAERDVNESLCVLYVALTRAKHALHMIIAPSSKSEKALPRTAAGLLRAALSDGSPLAPETVVYENGEPDWFRQIDPTRSGTTLKPDAAVEVPTPLIVQLASSPSRGARGLISSSPSRLEGGSHVKLADRWGVGVSAGKQFGTLIHAWMEQIQWLDDGLPDANQLRQTASQLDTANLDIDTRMSEFLAMLKRPNVSRLLSRANYAKPLDLPLPPTVLAELASAPTRLEVHTERRIAMRDGDSILTGNIDRLVLIFHGDKIVAADLIDFKTDKIAPEKGATVENKVDFYLPQLAAYRRAVSKMLRLNESRISARLLFVGPDVVKSV